jgi:hypothetical protein
MLKRLLVDATATIVVAAVGLLVLRGLESLPAYLMDYMLRSGIVYQGY